MLYLGIASARNLMRRILPVFDGNSVVSVLMSEEVRSPIHQLAGLWVVVGQLVRFLGALKVFKF